MDHLFGIVVVSAVLSGIIVFLISRVNLRLSKRRIKKINLNIYQTSILYFVKNDISDEHYGSFSRLVESRLKDAHLLKYLGDMKIVFYTQRIRVSYDFKFDTGKKQKVEFEIKKHYAVE